MVGEPKSVALLSLLALLLSIADAVRRPPAVAFRSSWHEQGAPSMPQQRRVAVARHAPLGSPPMVRHMSSISGPEALAEESEGIPLVYMAAQDGRPDVVAGLLESGYSPNQAVQGRTPVSDALDALDALDAPQRQPSRFDGSPRIAA